jgi:hypothetical protein
MRRHCQPLLAHKGWKGQHLDMWIHQEVDTVYIALQTAQLEDLPQVSSRKGRQPQQDSGLALCISLDMFCTTASRTGSSASG